MRWIAHEITREDVGKHVIQKPKCCICGAKPNPISISDFMGRILPIDVGKRIYKVDGIYQVENQAQLKARRKKNGKT